MIYMLLGCVICINWKGRQYLKIFIKQEAIAQAFRFFPGAVY